MSTPFVAPPDSGLRPENALLLCCARTSIDSDTAGRMRTLVRGVLDWDYIVGTASAHGVTPLLSYCLANTCADAAPKLSLDQLQRYLQIHSLKNLFLTRELIRLLGALEEIGISAIPWKGPVLAATAYGDIALRQFGDLDILVRERDAQAAKDLFLSLGYRILHQVSGKQEEVFHRARKVYELVREDGRVVVELHWAITSQTFYFPLDPGSLWEQVETVSLEGKPVRNLGPEDLLLVLCIHGAKHHWGKLMWICDIAAVLRAYSKRIDWPRLMNRAGSLGGARMLSLGLILAHDLLDAPIPEDVRQRVQADPKVLFLATEVRSGLFAGGPLMAVEQPSFYIHLRERAQDRMRCRFYLGYRMMAPSAQAWALRFAHSGRSVFRYLR